MKRHPALRDLSSDHHQGLVQARRLLQAAGGESVDTQAHATGREVAASEVADAAFDFLTFWAEHTNAHFREEEEVLLPAFAGYGNPAVEPVVQMLVEHVQIRNLVADLQSQVERGQPAAETMQTLGEMLRAHIRHEEDVVFPLIEEAMPEAALQELSGKLLAFAHHSN
jgi:hemerythrin-like domain-containing protein